MVDWLVPFLAHSFRISVHDRLVSLLRTTVRQNIMAEKALKAELLISWWPESAEVKRGPGTSYILSRAKPSVTQLLQVGPTSCSFYHLPTVHSNYKSLNGLSDKSSYSPITTPNSHFCTLLRWGPSLQQEPLKTFQNQTLTVVECSPSMRETLGPIPSTTKQKLHIKLQKVS